MSQETPDEDMRKRDVRLTLIISAVTAAVAALIFFSFSPVMAAVDTAFDARTPDSDSALCVTDAETTGTD